MRNQNKNPRLGLERAIIELGGIKGEEFRDLIRPIILGNLASGRVLFFLQHNAGSTPADYVTRVAEYYTRLNAYINQLQSNPSAAVWPPLFEYMQKLAYNILLRRQLIPGEVTFQFAVDSAKDAAVKLRQANFPYDTEFEAWMYQFVRFECLKTISREAKLAQQVVVAMDELEFEAKNGSLESDDGHLEWSEHLDLAIAMSKLTPKRQNVLRLRYIEGLSSKEAAQIMGNSVSAVDKLHYDAIKQLRKLLGDEQ